MEDGRVAMEFDDFIYLQFGNANTGKIYRNYTSYLA